METLISLLNSLDTSKAAVNIIDTGIGNIAEGDLKTAQSIGGHHVYSICSCITDNTHRNCIRIWCELLKRLDCYCRQVECSSSVR